MCNNYYDDPKITAGQRAVKTCICLILAGAIIMIMMMLYGIFTAPEPPVTQKYIPSAFKQEAVKRLKARGLSRCTVVQVDPERGTFRFLWTDGEFYDL